MQRILTGIQPSGILHIGNYFGAIRPIVEMQGRGEVFVFLADLHALTSLQDPARLREFSRMAALDLLACGLDPERTVFWRQSDVPEHSELMWVLSTVTPMGLLERAHAYKDKVARGQSANAGLFIYPVLQAADILLYDADLVPVGKDQKQHLEITRDVAGKINEAYGPVFKLPEPDIPENVATIPGLDGQKMSKSYGNTIDIFMEQKALRKRIMGIVTDSTPLEAPKDPDGSYLVELYRLFATPEQVEEMKASFRAGGTGYGHYKQQRESPRAPRPGGRDPSPRRHPRLRRSPGDDGPGAKGGGVEVGRRSGWVISYQLSAISYQLSVRRLITDD